MNRLNVITVKVGDRYSDEYVNKMISMLERHLKIPFDFYCLTENANNLDLPISHLIPSEVMEGWWNKLTLFSSLMPEGDILYADLDQVITGDIMEIVQECLKHPFSCYADHIEYCGEKFGSAFMTFKSGAHTDIYDRFLQERPDLTDYSGGDQVWIARTGLLPEVFYFNEKWPDAVKSYKFHIVPTDKAPREEVKLVNFHGQPKMTDVRGVKWIKENWR